MGFNTTIVVMNDALGEIRDDPGFGRRLHDAIVGIGGREVSAHGKVFIHANAAIVIETHHADHDVLVRVGGNRGVVESADKAREVQS